MTERLFFNPFLKLYKNKVLELQSGAEFDSCNFML